MTVRYYLIPAVARVKPDLPATEYGIEPKYLAALEANIPTGNITSMMGWLPAEIARDALGNRQWLKQFYILRIDATDFTQLDARTDVIRLTRAVLVANITKLQALGINTTGLTLTTPLKAIEQRLLLWLQGQNIDLSQATGLTETIPA
jgi:hypothetical protein